MKAIAADTTYLEALSTPELIALRDNIDALLRARRDEAKEALRRKLSNIARACGYTVN